MFSLAGVSAWKLILWWSSYRSVEDMWLHSLTVTQMCSNDLQCTWRRCKTVGRPGDPYPHGTHILRCSRNKYAPLRCETECENETNVYVWERWLWLRRVQHVREMVVTTTCTTRVSTSTRRVSTSTREEMWTWPQYDNYMTNNLPTWPSTYHMT